MPASADPVLSSVNKHFIVYLKGYDGNAINGRQAFNSDIGGIPDKMVTPSLLAGMKEKDNLICKGVFQLCQRTFELVTRHWRKSHF
ncbi:MAG: hypothetical protein GY796_06785 [Chloroflexi bacterium]|nr:hypothetical protein [Chloroflexota bacterium]